ncbi:olfactory receptor 5V1-like [Alligator mississippiensis]|uniref:olfactory receptor 5V1-like n=1 Tax=Alligator mississippiensis TaxID=8496 RepID=UPI0003D0C828|nr:olfactory receptor 5V1-like [Alligator mississippiensis]
MEGKNQTTEFIMKGFSCHPEFQNLLFAVIFIMYITSLLGNILISITVYLDSTLHAPMYYFISNLSLVDICYTSVTIPKLLTNLLSQKGTISFIGCAFQMYFLLFLGTTECFLLAVMAYDRFLAICNPLQYMVHMNKQLCSCLVGISWASGLLLSLVQTTLIFTLPYCGHNQIDHFFCDIPPLLHLACGDTSMNEIAVFVAGLLITLMPALLICVSYVHIISAVLKITSADGRHKTFSTCSSHLIVIILFYGSASAMYLRPRSSYVPESDRFLALFYSVVTPTLNPIIYSLRSKDINKALRRVITSRLFPLKM